MNTLKRSFHIFRQRPLDTLGPTGDRLMVDEASMEVIIEQVESEYYMI